MHHSPITRIYPKTEDFTKLAGQQIQGLDESSGLMVEVCILGNCNSCLEVSRIESITSGGKN